MSRNSLSTYDSAMLSDDGDLYSDEEDGSFGGELRNSLGEKIIPSAADRRAHHNALERKRRDHIKDSFSSLRDSVPSLQGEKITASRAQILKKAAEYIQFMRKKNTNVQQDIDELARQNKLLEDQIRKMEKVRPGSTGMTNQQLSSLFSSAEPTDVSTSYDISENSNGSSNSGIGPRPMIVSTVAAGTSAATATTVPAVSIINSIDNGNNSIKTNNGTVLNGTMAAGTVAVRPVTMKNGTSKIIVQNPQHKNTPHVIHVTTTPGGATAGNGVASNISMSGTGTPIIISTSQLSSPSSVSMGSTNGTNANGYVINKGAGAISLASVPNGFRTLVVQSAPGSAPSGTSAVTATPNIHILGTIPANNYSKQPPTKKIKISSDSDSLISPAGGGPNSGNNNSLTSVS